MAERHVDTFIFTFIDVRHPRFIKIHKRKTNLRASNLVWAAENNIFTSFLYTAKLFEYLLTVKFTPLLFEC